MSSMTKSKIRAARVIVVCAMATIMSIGTSTVALAAITINSELPIDMFHPN